jgi:hypothetical protein
MEGIKYLEAVAHAIPTFATGPKLQDVRIQSVSEPNMPNG